MIEKKKFQLLNCIKKEEYTGSMEGMRYMLKKKKGGEEEQLEVIIWPEPFGYAKTSEQDKQRKVFGLNHEGLGQAVDWLNEQLIQQQELWESGKRKG
ncbi:MAG: hypothetical protein IKM28_09475 [Lachnospiraceae bacterium]|nr:hypothetical protein [Lachnospiraceae bacterium]